MPLVPFGMAPSASTSPWRVPTSSVVRPGYCFWRSLSSLGCVCGGIWVTNPDCL